MPQLNHKGPDRKGSATKRNLGNCKPKESEQNNINKLVVGLGLK